MIGVHLTYPYSGLHPNSLFRLDLETLFNIQCNTLLCRTYSSGSSCVSLGGLKFCRSRTHWEPHLFQIGIVNAPQAKRLDHPITAIIAGSAPTAHLIGELEKISMRPVHVYGLT